MNDTVKTFRSSDEKNKTEKGVLYLVATPIGNLADISARALKVLSEVDFIAAEDTRNSARLLSYFEISKPLISYHEHNRAERGMEIIDRLRAGESAALITDAGTPAISDPGADLVCLCAEHSVPVTSVPGCCAAITALTLSALPTDRFCFEGFLPTKNTDRRERLEVLSRERRTSVLHEAPHKLRNTLSDLCKTLGGERRISLCREMTKLNEEVMRTTLAEAVSYYVENEPRGEYVLVLEGCSADEAKGDAFWSEMSIKEHVEYYINGGMAKMDAIKKAAMDRGVHKNEIYREMV